MSCGTAAFNYSSQTGGMRCHLDRCASSLFASTSFYTTKSFESLRIASKCTWWRNSRPAARPREDQTSIAAYTRAPTLTHSECKMVARASGLTHQQVRTWFQNKRSRDKKQSRIRSMRSTYRRTIDDSDRGLSPPAAGAAHLDQLVHAPPLGRELELASSGCQTLSSPSIKG
ncbi:hypothetical protein VHUM_00812 [Vanrija humicola]|uniref:Homeobox domain-containing protein n=1 Tax=Vanrija humicola TaxID=5417 RepID=A0A7D8V1S6_VANHU|nr:hypothetical protein VHUM_00812 [Vanrija humicola]